MGASHFLKHLKVELSAIMTWAPKVCSLVGKFLKNWQKVENVMLGAITQTHLLNAKLTSK